MKLRVVGVLLMKIDVDLEGDDLVGGVVVLDV